VWTQALGGIFFALISLVLFAGVEVHMYRTGNNVEIKLRLNEINRRSIALSTTSSELANLAAQLDHLRQANERISRLAVRMAHSKRGRAIFYRATSGGAVELEFRFP
jgi:hypothetical protein